MKYNTSPVPGSARFAGLFTLMLVCRLSTLSVRADNEIWIGSPGVSTSTNWSDPANWSGTSKTPNDNQVFFGNASTVAAGVINSVVDATTNCFSLNFTNTASYQNVLIQAGQTLKIDGNNLGQALSVNPLGQAAATNTISGANGTLLISGASAGGVFVATTNSAASGIAPVLDLSGLGTFIVSNTAGTAAMLVGNGANRSDGILFLAMTNYLKLATNGSGNSGALVIGDNTSNNGSSPGGVLNLGLTNQIFADYIGVGLSKQSSALLRFNPAFTNGGANPVVVLRGNSTTAVKTWAIGDGLNQTGTSASGSGTVDLRNGTVNAVVTTLLLGRCSPPSTTTPSSSGSLIFNAGNISVVNLTNAMTTVLNSGTNQSAKGTITVNDSATLSVANVAMAQLANPSSTSTGTLNITNGTVALGTLTVGTGTSTLNFSGGTLIITNTCGTPALPLSALNLNGGTLQFNVNGTSLVTNLVAATVTTGTATTIAIGAISGVTSTTTFPLIKYTGGADPFAALTLLATLPNGYTGNLSDNTAAQTIDLVLTPPSVAASLVWVGATNSVLTSYWDTTTVGWLNAGTLSPATYGDLDSILFDDTASNNVVTLTTNVVPFSLLISNNALNYTFNGPGKISGSSALIKTGAGLLTLAESGGDAFNGGLIVSNGTLVLDQAGSAISGGLLIAGGTVQLGNNDANGALPAGLVTDNGSLIFNRTDALTLNSALGGTGSVIKNNSDLLTLSGNNTFAGGLTANAGTVRLTTANAAGTGAITVNPGATAVLGTSNILNNVTLAGGTLGFGSAQNPLRLELTAAAGTTSTLVLGDPANLSAADATEVVFTNSGTWHGNGTVIVTTVLNDPTADSGNGLRLRGLAASDFSGTIILSNSVKGELQTTVAGSFSPVGTGRVVIYAGTQTNNTVNGTYAELNLRNLSPGNAVIGNNLEVAGTGLAVLDPLGTAPAGATVTMGNLKIGDGQELGVNLNGSTLDHVIIFPSVTLTGGTARFSPKTPGWNTTPQIGSDLSLGNITETAPSGLVMNGLRTLTLTGNSSYSGSTTVSNGTLEVDGSLSGTGAVTVNAGATLTGTGAIAGPVTIAAGGTLSPGSLTVTTNATLAIGNTLQLSGTNIMDVNKTGTTFTSDRITAITSLTLGGTLQLNLTGAALAAGDAIPLYGCNSASGTFANIIPAAPGAGLAWNTRTLANGVLSVATAVNTNSPVLTSAFSGNSLTLSWPADHIGWRLQVQTNSLESGLGGTWVEVPAAASQSSIILPVGNASGAVFYRLIYP
ncbi:MAG: autotransporter-associated beta strand repeat-containing protein [Verrucomicrobiota bacterium]